MKTLTETNLMDNASGATNQGSQIGNEPTSLTSEQKKLLFRNLARAMALDRLMMRIIRAGKMVGFYHEGGVALAPGVAAGTFLRQDDIMWIHYRAHGIAHMVSKGIDVKLYVAEHMGREVGCCKGRSSFHPSFPGDHVFGFSGNIGANFPACVGYGFAAKYKKKGQIVLNCSGDGSYGEGRAHEGLHLAVTWGLPIVFWCENNGMAQHSPITDIFPIQDISRLAAAYGMPTKIVDGQDLFACGAAALEAIAHVRDGRGPIFIELKTLRSQEHNVGGLNYEGPRPRDPQLMEEWKTTRDPLKLAAAKLIEEGTLTADDVEQIRGAADQEADEIEAFCDQSPKATPAVEELLTSVFAS